MNATQKTKELFLVHRKRKTRNQTVYNKQNKIGLCTELKNKAVFFHYSSVSKPPSSQEPHFHETRSERCWDTIQTFFSFQPNLGLKKQKYLCSEIFFGILFSFAFRQNGFCKKFCLGQSFGP